MKNYVELAITTESPITPELCDRSANCMRAVHALMGIQTESGELADGFKRHIFYGKDLDLTNIAEEIGDILWYVAILCDFANISLEDCMKANIEKLSNRYPEKFTEYHALNRDLNNERKILESTFDNDRSNGEE